jgi:hypothetical protein
VPRLLRVKGLASSGGPGTERAGRVTGQLEQLLRAFDETPRKRSTLEAPTALTRAYVSFEFAWGFARLGLSERARRLRDDALSALDLQHPAHAYLTRAYGVRIDQALEGVSPETPLPAEISGLLVGLEPFARFKVDKLRQASTILEPQERLDVYATFTRSAATGRGEELGALRGLAKLEDLQSALEERAVAAADRSLTDEARVRVLDGLLDFLPQLPESQALQLLQRLVQVADSLPAKLKLPVLEDALKVAGHFGRAPVVRQLVLMLSSLIKELGPEGVLELGSTLVAGVRSLRRVGLRDEAAEVLARASSVLKGEDPRTLQARLALASGFAYLGNAKLAHPLLEEAQARLSREAGLGMPDRLRLTRAAARALGHSALEVALPGLARLAQQLPWITDSLTTNEYFCLSLIDFADALVLGHVGEDLTLNELTRRFLEEDEHLVRRRIHRDVEGTVS